MSKKNPDSKKRLDQLLIERGLALDLDKACKMIMAGEVLVDESRDQKPGTLVSEKSSIRLIEKGQFVSRGGDKLQAAIDYFVINILGQVAIDIGSSTGGFTDCLLKNGVSKVYALDVGKNELDWSLRNDKRVVALDGVNARELDQFPKITFNPVPTFATIDVSFISLTLVLPPLLKLLSKGSQVLALIKPQFELPKEDILDGGVVKDPELHKKVCKTISDFSIEIGFSVKGIFESPVRGARKGNQEFFIWLCLG
ncbi:MAG: TlyA family RNA methyltransferase [bacterium]|nr:TlyA family RNA methyltransferase [bacterium]